MATTAAINMPKKTTYGAIELKEFILKSTMRGFIITITLIVILLIIYMITTTISESARSGPKVAPIVKLKLEDLPPPPSDDMDAPPPPPPETIINTGPAARAGTPVPVPDAEIKPDMQEFATIDVMSRASAEGGDGVDLGNWSSNIDFDVNVETREEEPDPDEFIPVEKEPDTDFGALQKLVVYPDLARRAGVEGKVLVRVLVGKSGKVTKVRVDYTDNELLNEAAITAVRKAVFTPAIQNKQPVQCWVTVPIVFKLR